MGANAIEIKFYGRRKLTYSKKRRYKIAGITEILFGLLGLIINGFEISTFFPFFAVFVIAGIGNIVYGIIGKGLLKEENFVSMGEEEIRYKNSFAKPKRIRMSELLDLRMEKARVEFVRKDQRLETWDFSVFQGHEQEMICGELEKIKTNLI
jgi:hypothetical protein